MKMRSFYPCNLIVFIIVSLVVLLCTPYSQADAGTLDTLSNAVVIHNGAAVGIKWNRAHSITTDAFGNIIAAGLSGNYDMAIWRYKPDGTLDSLFNGVGFVTHNSAAGGNGLDLAYSVTTDASGNIVAAGESLNIKGGSDMAIWRYKPDGTLDTSFNGVGYVTHNNAAGGNGFDHAYGVTTDASGNIAVIGYSDNASRDKDMVIWRYKPDGTLDSLFKGVSLPK